MLRDNFFRMSMQKPLQHSFVYGSVWPTILKDKDTTKTENVKVLIVTNTWTCEGYYLCHGGRDFICVCLLGGGWVFDFGLKNLACLVIISGGGLPSTAYCSIVVLWGFHLEVSVVSFCSVSLRTGFFILLVSVALDCSVLIVIDDAIKLPLYVINCGENRQLLDPIYCLDCTRIPL